MKILQLLEEDTVNYKKTCMTVMFPYCTFKCNREAGYDVCHNSWVTSAALIDIEIDDILERYINNPLSEAIVMQGLEPLDSFEELYALLYRFTEKSSDDIVIYTGYTEAECIDKIRTIKDMLLGNKLIVKFGRFIPNDYDKFDDTLGVTLRSSNQYAKEI